MNGTSTYLSRSTRSLLAALAALFALGVFASSALAADEALDPISEVAPGVYIASGSDADAGGGSAPSTAGDSERQPKIVGGTPIDISQAPWQVGFTVSPQFFQGDASQRQFCGGTLVAPTLVITAAHCLFNQDATGFNFPPNELAAVTGRTVLSSTQGQEIPLADYFVFVDDQGRPLYNPQNSAWDVAVLRLSQPSSAGTIKVVGATERELWVTGRAAFVTGWGHTKFEGQGSDQLLSAETVVQPDDECTRVFGATGFTSETSLCAGIDSGKRDSCQGDSGGPLVVPTADGTSRLIGDVQAGIKCALRDTPGSYGRFGDEPLQSALRNVGLQVGGVDIIGSGGTPPTTIGTNQAIELSWIAAEQECESSRKCRAFFAASCKPSGTGSTCVIGSVFKLRGGGKKTCRQTVLWTGESGTIQGQGVGKAKCKRKG